MARILLCIAVILLPASLISCTTDEDRMRERIVGEYTRDIDHVVRGMRHREHHELSLLPNGLWKQKGWAEVDGRRHEGRADFGSYRIQGVMLNLHSKIEPGIPYKYTISGDTLYSANASFTYAVTGLDIGDSFMVKVR